MRQIEKVGIFVGQDGSLAESAFARHHHYSEGAKDSYHKGAEDQPADTSLRTRLESNPDHRRRLRTRRRRRMRPVANRDRHLYHTPLVRPYRAATVLEFFRKPDNHNGVFNARYLTQKPARDPYL